MKKYVYTCTKCSNRIVVHVTPSAPPTCSKHTGGGVIMKLDEKSSTGNPHKE